MFINVLWSYTCKRLFIFCSTLQTFKVLLLRFCLYAGSSSIGLYLSSYVYANPTIQKIFCTMNTLSICIPTYNRCSYLNESLGIIFSQIQSLPQKYKELCDIYVFNNGSTDDTQHLLSYYKSKYPSILTVLDSEDNLPVFVAVSQLLNASSSLLLDIRR